MEFLSEYGMFLLKTATFVIAAMFVIGNLIQLKKSGQNEQGQLDVTPLNERYDYTRDAIAELVDGKKVVKKRRKEREKADKKKTKAGGEAEKSANLYVVDFVGDMQAKAVTSLREEISAILGNASKSDEVLVRLESGGGVVHGYGLAASQLDRLRNAGIPLTIAVDKVAASGGYMMACVADKIIAAPFAILGSIGVVAQMPNFNKLLRKNEIDIELHTAGEYKRTLTMLGENSDKGREKFVEDLELTHGLFKHFVSEHRPSVNIDEVATGEIWFGRQAVDNLLIDEVKTSDEYVLEKITAKQNVYLVKYTPKKSLSEKLGKGAESSLVSAAERLWQRIQSNRFMS